MRLDISQYGPPPEEPEEPKRFPPDPEMVRKGLEIGGALRNEAMRRVQAARVLDYAALRDEALDVVALAARSNRDFISDDIWTYVGPDVTVSVKERRVMGPVLGTLSRQGHIWDTGKKRMGYRMVNHNRPQTVWYPGAQPVGVLAMLPLRPLVEQIAAAQEETA